MPDPEPPPGAVDEFDWIARCLAPLAAEAPEALGLLDDAAVVPARPGHDLVISKDAMVEGVHFLPDDPLAGVAGKLLRVNLSDLAAKGAEPYGYFLAVAWPASRDWAARAAFARGLEQDQRLFGLRLFGGDTVATPGALTASLTILGWAPEGRMVRRGGARPGDLVLVTGSIGDGFLGLEAARGGLTGLEAAGRAYLAARYRAPTPRLELAPALRRWASAAADVSDGLIADAGRIAIASKVRVTLDLERMPLSPPAVQWLAGQGDARAARLELAAGGDDYEVVCTAGEVEAAELAREAARLGLALTPVGRVSAGLGVEARLGGKPLPFARAGYRHG